ncbi:unnamed protein product [Closterium sp. Naga37s-1]|nr:unnamed protein product [Closterium sp. Naga37s-1]
MRARVLPTALHSLATLPSSQPPFLTLSWAACHTSLQAPSPPPRGAPSSAVSAPPPPSPLTPSASSPSSSSPHSFLPSVPFLPSSTSFPSASATWLRVTDCHLVIVTLLPPNTPLLHPPPPLLSPSISPTLSPLPPPLFSPYLLQLVAQLTTSPLFLLFSLSNTALLLSPPPYGASSRSYLFLCASILTLLPPYLLSYHCLPYSPPPSLPLPPLPPFLLAVVPPLFSTPLLGFRYPISVAALLPL